MNLLPHSFSLRYDGYPKPIDKEELRKKKAEEIWASLSPKERAVQVQMDQHVNNILFAGYVPECPTDGRFICFSCHHEWTASVRQVYKRKACGQCGVSYRKVDG